MGVVGSGDLFSEPSRSFIEFKCWSRQPRWRRLLGGIAALLGYISTIVYSIFLVKTQFFRCSTETVSWGTNQFLSWPVDFNVHWTFAILIKFSPKLLVCILNPRDVGPYFRTISEKVGIALITCHWEQSALFVRRCKFILSRKTPAWAQVATSKTTNCWSLTATVALPSTIKQEIKVSNGQHECIKGIISSDAPTWKERRITWTSCKCLSSSRK